MKTFVKILSFMLAASISWLLCQFWHDWSWNGIYVKGILLLGVITSLSFLLAVSFPEESGE